MQKKLIALAIAGLSGAAFAQSNVTIYGVVDSSFESAKATGATATAAGVADAAQNMAGRARINSNSSYIGFKGAESLGNGLTAVFQIETQFAIDNANNNTAGTRQDTWANRDSYVGVAGGFGTAVVGYLSTPHRSLAAGFDVMPGATGPAGFNNLIGKINVGASQNTATGFTANTFGATNANLIFRTQALAYITPTFNGFSGVVAYVPAETGKRTLANNAAGGAGAAGTTTDAWNLALNYANGPLKAGYSFLTQKDPFAGGAATGILAAGTGGKLKSQIAGIGYTFNGATTVNLMWNTNKIDVSGTAVGATTGVKNTVWGLGVKHVMGAHELAAMYQRATDGTVATGGLVDNASGRGATNWGFRYGYNFSKRTSVYGVYSKITNKANGNYDFGAGAAVANASSVAAISAGADPTAFGIGLRHSF